MKHLEASLIREINRLIKSKGERKKLNSLRRRLFEEKIKRLKKFSVDTQ